MFTGMNARKANLMLLAAAFLWDSGFVATQYAFDAGIQPFQLVCMRMFIASCCLSFFFRKNLKSIRTVEIYAGVIIGTFLFLGFGFQSYGQALSTPSINAFVTAVYVIFIPFIKRLFTREKQDVYANIGACLTVIGIGMISLTDYGLSMSWGVILTLICAVFYAFQVVFTDSYTKKYDPINLTIIITMFNFVLNFIASAVLAIVNRDLPSFSTKGLYSVLYLGLLCTFIAYICQNVGQKYTSAVKAAIIMSLEAVFGVFLAAVIYGEELSVQMVIGCVIVFSAIIVSETKLEFLRPFFKKKKQAAS